jgi:hypothetical protein
MFRPLEPRSVRRGNTLIVVLSCLSLLAVVGLTAVYLAKDQAEAARNRGQPGVDAAFTDNGMGAFNYYLATLIYDAPDSGQGMLNAARGPSLMGTMYGRYGTVGGVFQQGGGIIPWNGVGIFGVTNESVLPSYNGNAEPPYPRVDLRNYRVFASPPAPWYDPEFAGNRSPGATPNSASYIPSNAAYTYPDLNNFFLAAQCPATGEVIIPSYYRPNTPGSFGSLDPANPNWRNGTGATQTPRPTQAVHPQFPTVPANADGSYTGDVPNIPGAFYYNSGTGQWVAKNDSIWIDIGLPPFTLPNGKRVKALVAPLVLDLNGRLNLSVHGNRLNGGLAAGAHTSGAGFGPWEISLERAFGANFVEARNVVTNRWGGTTLAGTAQRAFAPRLAAGNQIPFGSAVPWTGNGGSAPASLLLPGQGTNSMFSPVPAYTPVFTAPSAPGYDSTNTAVINHPALLNPNEFPSFPLSDTKQLSARYGAPPFYYSTFSPTLANSAPNTFKPSLPYTPGPGATTSNSFRLDPADANRMLFTQIGYDLDRIGLSPPMGQTQALFGGLGGIDLNRKLADYRLNTTLPLGPGNMAAPVAYGTGTALQADIDRQLFARDIFARLIVATNAAGASVTPTTGVVTITELPGTNNYNNLRNLAQVAANIVDYIDDDDISTTFVWNPAAWTDPFAPANFTTVINTVVFGTEKPRIVLNEAYAEITNDPTDPAFSDMTKKTTAQKAAQVRFWLELQNPSSPPYALGGTGPLGAGVAKVRYTVAADGVTFSPYIVQIVRSQPLGFAAAGFTSVSSTLRNAADPNYPANVLGAIAPAGVGPAADLTFDFSAADATPAVYSLSPAQTNPQTTAPNAANSVLVCAANVPSVQGPEFNPAGFGGFPNLIPASQPGAGVTSSLTYTIPLATVFPQAATAPTTDILKHVVVLQRLANPYLAPSATNPYITVDFMDSVPASDRVLLPNNTTNANPRTAKTTFGGAGGMGSTGYDPNTPPAAGNPDLRPRSLGKVQPFTSYTDPNAAYQTTSGTYNFTFPKSLVLPQNPAVDPGQGVLHTFTRHNGTTVAGPAVQTYVSGVPATLNGTGVAETLMTPYDWLVQLDRPVINQLEVLHVTAGKPYLFTQQSVAPNPTNTDVVRFTNSIQQNILSNPAFAQIYQALDLLRIQPYGHMTALGGRIPGRININTIMDKRVWDALFDAQVGLNGFTQAQVDQMWNGLMASRTQSMQQRFNTSGGQLTDAAGLPYTTPVPGASVYDTGTAVGDRPFLPFGVATIPAGGSTLPNGYQVNNGGLGFNTDSLLRLNGATGLPWLFQTPLTNPHPYQQLEAARKILNNVTTVSHDFAVFATVGYFEVTNETPSGIPNAGAFVQLGKEYYQNTPGDTRYKFFAIVDRSMVGLDPLQYKAAAVAHATAQPFFTTVSTYIAGTQPITPAGNMTINVAASTGSGTSAQVYSNGQPVDLMSGSATLVIGNGATQEIASIASVSFNGTGVATVTLTAALQFNHGPGESVSNILPGNPGPQASFDVTQAPYNYVVPFWAKLQ